MRGGHLGQVTSIMSSDFHFLVPESFHKNLVQIGTLVSEKIRFEFLYVHVHDLGPRSRNDLDLQYSHTFLYSIRCLLLLYLRSLAAIVSTPDWRQSRTISHFQNNCLRLPNYYIVILRWPLGLQWSGRNEGCDLRFVRAMSPKLGQ